MTNGENTRRFTWTCVGFLTILSGQAVLADGAQDNRADGVRPVPPPGVEVSAADKTQLESSLNQLRQRISELRGSTSPAVKRACS